MFKLLFGVNRTNWHWGMGCKLSVDFAVWVLEQDGLRVPPFDQHPPRKGELSAVGLNAENWREWFLSLVVEESASSRGALDYPYSRLPVTFQPALFFREHGALQDKLDSMWEIYKHIAKRRRAFERDIYPSGKVSPREQRRFFNELDTARGNLPPVDVMLVGYPAPLSHVVPPATIVLAPLGAPFGFENLRAVMLEGLAALRQLS